MKRKKPQMMLWCSALCTIVFGLGVSSLSQAQTALASLEKSIDAEQRSVVKQVQLTFVRDGVAEETITEINQPNQMHMVRKTGGHELEFYAIKPQLYWRFDHGPWTLTPIAAGATPQLPISPTKLLLAGMTNVEETPPQKIKGVTVRTFHGAINWQVQGTTNTGKLTCQIRQSTLLPTTLDFTGQCGGRTCTFHQTFAYDKAVKISDPTK